MENVTTRPQVLVPFVCPICAAPNAVALIPLSRAGGVECVGCKKHLRSTDVMRAMHTPRPAGATASPSPRAAAEKPGRVWPPTPESRAAVAPLQRRRDGRTN